MQPENIIAVYHLQIAAIQYARANTRIIPLIPEKKLPIMKCWWERSTCDEELVRFFWDVGPYNPKSILTKLNAPIFRELFGLTRKDARRKTLYDALLKEEDLDQLRNPHFNIGIATGTANGITVFDIDTKNNKDGSRGTDNWRLIQERYGPFDLNPEVLTPSKGTHVYHRYDPRFKNKANIFSEYPGIDVRNNGGLIVAPPSKVWRGNANGSKLVPYRWKDKDELFDLKALLKPVPEVLAKLLKKQKSEKNSAVQTKKQSKSDHQHTIQSNLKSVIEIIKKDHPGVPEGTRNEECLKVCRKLVGKFRTLSEDEMLEALRSWNDACDPPLDEKDLIRKLQSTIRRRESDEASGIQWAKPSSSSSRPKRYRPKIKVDPKCRPFAKIPKDMYPQPDATVETATEFLIEEVTPNRIFANEAAQYLVYRFTGLTDQERLSAMEAWFSFETPSEEIRRTSQELLVTVSKEARIIHFSVKNESQVSGLA